MPKKDANKKDCSSEAAHDNSQEVLESSLDLASLHTKIENIPILIKEEVQQAIDNLKEAIDNWKQDMKCELENLMSKHINQLEITISNMSHENKSLKETIEKQYKCINDMKVDCAKCKHEIKYVHQWANRNEQYSRKYNFRVIGLKETNNEDTKKEVIKLFHEKANVDISPYVT